MEILNNILGIIVVLLAIKVFAMEKKFNKEIQELKNKMREIMTDKEG